MLLRLGGDRRLVAVALAAFASAAALASFIALRELRIEVVIPVVAVVAATAAWMPQLVRWRSLLTGLLLVILFIPIKRYNIPGGLPFDLEPYRVVVAAIAVIWVLALLADPRIRLRRSGLEIPLAAILFFSLLSDVVNLDRVRPLSNEIFKGQTFFLSFFIVFALVVSLVRTRTDVDYFVRVLAIGGAILSFFGIIERRTGYNVFDHLGTVLPFLHFEGSGEHLRSGRLRIVGSSQHPIALGVLLVILLPLAIYLARRHGRWWLGVAALYVIAIFTTASRTGIIGIAVVGIVYLFLQRRTVLRAWPLVFPLLVVIHFVAPGAIGTIRQTLDPTTLLAEQSTVVAGNDAYASGRLTDVRPTLEEWSQKPLLGQGFGTRIVTGSNPNARLLDNQWLGTLLETGYLGICAWLTLFVLVIRRLWRAAVDAGSSSDGWLLTGFAASITASAISMAFYDALSFVQNIFVLFIMLALAAVLLNPRSPQARKHER